MSREFYWGGKTPQQIVVCWEGYGCPKNTQTLKKHHLGQPNFFLRNFFKCWSLAYNWIFSSSYNSHDNVKGYFALFWLIYTCLWLLSEYILVPHKIWMPQNTTFANLGHPYSKSWLSPCLCFWLLNDKNRYVKVLISNCFVLYSMHMHNEFLAQQKITR